MSKYDLLWQEIKKRNEDSLTLSNVEIENILGFPIDQSFLKF